MKIKASRLLVCAAISSALIGATSMAQEKSGDDLAIEEVLVTPQKRTDR